MRAPFHPSKKAILEAMEGYPSTLPKQGVWKGGRVGGVTTLPPFHPPKGGWEGVERVVYLSSPLPRGLHLSSRDLGKGGKVTPYVKPAKPRQAVAFVSWVRKGLDTRRLIQACRPTQDPLTP
jgi:hypothetical protein